ncbi:hypothetical protein RUND412_004560 [Rhizina undulata]
MDSEDGQLFIKHIAHYVRTHEKALANALQLQRRQPAARRGEGSPSAGGAGGVPTSPSSYSSTSSTLAAAFSMPSLSFTSQHLKPAKLSLTPHHLYYLLMRFEELNIPVGPMNVRLENLHSESSPGYVSFLKSSSRRRNGSSDSLSIHSVSSVKSVMSGMSSLWSSFGLGASSISKSEKAKAAIESDLKYLYSAFTKIPCLRLAPDRKARLIEGYEEFPFDTAVPLLAFKNVSALEICDIDIRQFFGWDQMSERLRSLSVRRAGIEDPAELIIAIVLDDMDRRRRRSAKSQSSPIIPSSSSQPVPGEAQASSAPPSPTSQTESQLGGSAPASHYHPMSRGLSDSSRSSSKTRPRSSSPSRPSSSKNSSTSTSHHRSHRMRRSGSGSSHSSSTSTLIAGSQNALPMGSLPSTKWRFLRHLSLADNSLTSISTAALFPLANSLSSLDLSSNLFVQIPDSLSILSNLRALNLSNNMIDSLHSLTRNPLPAITALNLRGNRLASIAGIERLLSLERLDLRENKLTDPTEIARLTGAPNLSEIWVAANPFTKTHSSTYRVTIFNLFRNTPGYIEDITLDSQSPGIVEKRSLVDRVAEVPNVPVMKVSQSQIVNTVHKKERMETEKFRVVSASEVAKARKKLGRRRVVELSRDESNASIGDEHNLAGTLGSKLAHVSYPSQRTPPVSTPTKSPTAPKDIVHPQEEASSGAESSPPQSSSSPPSENVDWAQKGDEYRRRVEALKNEVGSGWLSVLSEEGLSLASTRKGSPTTQSAANTAQEKRSD